MVRVSTILVSLALAVSPAVMSITATAATPPATLSPADTAAAQALAKQIEAALLALPKDATHADLQRQIQQLIVASGLQPSVVYAALQMVETVLMNSPNEPLFALTALQNTETRVVAQLGTGQARGLAAAAAHRSGVRSCPAPAVLGQIDFNWTQRQLSSVVFKSNF